MWLMILPSHLERHKVHVHVLNGVSSFFCICTCDVHVQTVLFKVLLQEYCNFPTGLGYSDKKKSDCQ